MKLHAPAAARNCEPIAAVLARVVPSSGEVLEVASGSGEHVVAFAERFGAVQFQPSDVDSRALASIDAHVAASGVANVEPALLLDARSENWPISGLDGVININMIHIASWQTCLGLLNGAGHAVKAGGFLFLYGPFIRDALETAASNRSFDASLRARNPAWGIRHLDDVAAEARTRGFDTPEVVEMPANNVSVIFRRL